MMPIGSHSQPQAITARTVSASGMSTAAAASGANHLSRLAVNEKTIPICFSRWPNETFSCGGFAMRGSLVAAASGLATLSALCRGKYLTALRVPYPLR